MPSLTHLGVRLTPREPGPVHRTRKPQPVVREKRYWFEWGTRRYCLMFLPWQGLSFTGSMGLAEDQLASVYLSLGSGVKLMKRVTPPTGLDQIRPALSHESKLLAKCPQFCRYLTDTAYDDGSPRTPGGFFWNNRWTLLEVVLLNPDAGARLPVVAPTIDEMFAALEAVVRLDDAPWQPDKRLMEELQKRGKKK